MEHLKRLTARKISLVAIFSALYYVISFLPALKFVFGGVRVSVNIEAFIASIFGLLMGPYLGALTGFVGAFTAWVLPPGTPSPTSAVFLLAPAINAFIVGLIYTKKWKTAFVTLAIVISAFWFLPAAQPWNQYFHIGLFVMWDKIIALALIIPSGILMNRMIKSSVKATENPSKPAVTRKIDPIFVLSLVAAVLILINAWVIGSGGPVNFEFNLFGASLELKLVSNKLLPTIASYGYLWFLLGGGTLVCAALFYLKPERRRMWSTLVFALSCASVVIGGGFFIGLFLGVLGGIFGITERKFTLPRITVFGDTFLYFLLAYIGNEADNALASDIFAIPFVYERVYQIPSVEALRLIFLSAPFLYFAIRFFQAIITTLIATPLLRNLKAAGYDTVEPLVPVS